MILHVDMDAFFAAVEQLDQPTLKGQCVVVGGSSGRGVVAAASYEARRFGIHSAMPMFKARRQCPQLVVVSPRKARYQEVSKQIMDLLQRYTPMVEQISIDEAYMDARGCDRLFGSPARMAKDIKRCVRQHVGLTCSVGVAASKFLAKIASDIDKPDGLTIISAADAPAFIAELPVAKVPGVGQNSCRALEKLGIERLGDVHKIAPAKLQQHFGKFGQRLIDLSRGIDRSQVTIRRPVKSISEEVTLAHDSDDPRLLRRYLLQQAADVGRRLRKARLKARVVTLKIKFYDFQQITKRVTLTRPTQSSMVIYNNACRLLEAGIGRKKIRLIGVGAAGLLSVDTPQQAELFPVSESSMQNWGKVESAVDRITSKFGREIIKKASLTD